jgi:hypothetical protein
VDPTWLEILTNLDRIGAYALLLVGIWGLITGRLVTPGRLADTKELVAQLREENAELRRAVESGNDAQKGIERQMIEINRLLERLAAEGLRRDAERLNRRIWEESTITEALMRRIRLRWLGERIEEVDRDADQG